MNKINRWVIGTLPYTILFAIILVYQFQSNYYFFLGATCVVLFVANLLTNRQFVIHGYTFFILLFGIFVIYSNAYVAQNKFIFYNEIFKNQYIYAFFVLNIIENTTFSKRQIRRWFPWFELVVWVSLMVILVQQFHDHKFFTTKTALDTMFEKSYLSQSEIRLASIFTWSGVSDLIFYFVPITFFLINYEINRKKVFKAVLYSVLLIAVCVLSKARTSMMAAVPFLLILQSSYQKKKIGITGRNILIIFLLFSTYIAFTSIPFLSNILKDRILETSNVDAETRTMHTRWIAVQAFVKCFPDQPILGAGNTKYSSGGKGQWNYKLTSFLAGRSGQIHVGFLDLFYLYGLVGGILFSMFMYLALKKLYKKSIIYNFPSVFWGLMTLPLANIGLVSFNVMSAGLLLSFVLYKNLENFSSKTEVYKEKVPDQKFI
jgi:hypothetical protein